LVERFFRGIASGSMRDIERALAPDAVVIDRTGKATLAQKAWSARLALYDYRDTIEHPAITESDVQVVDVEDEMASAVRTLVQPQPDELLLRADVQRPMHGNQRRFGDVLWFIAAVHQGHYQIRAIIEDFALP